MPKWILFFILLFSCQHKNKLPIQFVKEDIFFKIDSNEVSIEGEYYFKNRTETTKRMGLFYPFPIDEKHLYPHYIEVEDISFTKEANGINFDVRLKPFENKKVVVKYRQRILTNNAKYILLTARKWREPIEEANFIISAQENLQPTISYKPDSVVTKDNRIFYYIKEIQLYPSSDLIVSWDYIK